MSLAIGVFGIPGVGKSTLLDEHAARQPLDRHIGGSSVVKAIIAPSSVRELDAWPLTRQEAVRRESIRRLTHLRDNVPRCLVVAGHFSLRNRVSGELERILTEADHAFFDALVHIDASVDTVFAQTAGDRRARHGQTREQIADHLIFERCVAAETATIMGVPHCRIEASSLEHRTAHLEAFLESIVGGRP